MCLTGRDFFLLKLRLTTATVKIVEFKSFGELRVLWCCRNALFVVICFVVSFRLRWGLIVTVRAGHDHTIAHGKLPVSSVSRGIVVFDNTGFGKFVDQTCSPLLTTVSPDRCLVVCINPRQYKLPTSLYISAHCIQSCVVFQMTVVLARRLWEIPGPPDVILKCTHLAQMIASHIERNSRRYKWVILLSGPFGGPLSPGRYLSGCPGWAIL